ncbi:MAG: membrane protein insertion efficiency factor YidD [Clostridia bacterium]|nr:membrane protein insertion efficiency factor YidD [Clostridia bacterium]MDD6041153.1 membrane protein insertion efficiency factor YidD [Clostridia bacterium]
MKKLFLKLIRFYQRHISVHTPPACRFQPTCSQYAYTAIERFGVLKGGWLAIRRLLRCNPFCRGGYDPVPEAPPTTLRRD